MLENHSYDNILGMLGRGPGERPRGDGFTLAADGLPTATNPYPDGRLQRAFRMPTTCQLPSKPSQEWTASHNQFDGGKLDGFVSTPISYGTSQRVGPVAMGYWTAEDLPLTYALARTFPIGDRWFCSTLTDTDPNRRYLIAATSQGMTGDMGTGPGNAVPNSLLSVPAKNGTIFTHLKSAGVSWRDYNAGGATGTTMNLYLSNDYQYTQTNAPPVAQFFKDAKAGKLPHFSLIDPNYSTQSQENPQNITIGEGFLGRVIRRAARIAELAQDAPDPDLRRARWLLRPRSASQGAGAGLVRTEGQPRREDLRRVHPLWLPGADDPHRSVRQA